MTTGGGAAMMMPEAALDPGPPLYEHIFSCQNTIQNLLGSMPSFSSLEAQQQPQNHLQQPAPLFLPSSSRQWHPLDGSDDTMEEPRPKRQRVAAPTFEHIKDSEVGTKLDMENHECTSHHPLINLISRQDNGDRGHDQMEDVLIDDIPICTDRDSLMDSSIPLSTALSYDQEPVAVPGTIPGTVSTTIPATIPATTPAPATAGEAVPFVKITPLQKLVTESKNKKKHEKLDVEKKGKSKNKSKHKKKGKTNTNTNTNTKKKGSDTEISDEEYKGSTWKPPPLEDPTADFVSFASPLPN